MDTAPGDSCDFFSLKLAGFQSNETDQLIILNKQVFKKKLARLQSLNPDKFFLHPLRFKLLKNSAR
jgi:hypothetical protein